MKVGSTTYKKINNDIAIIKTSRRYIIIAEASITFKAENKNCYNIKILHL